METLLGYPRLEEILDRVVLEQHITNGLVATQQHPTLPLTIFNYTHRAQWDAPWGDGVIDWCRGLIIDEHGYVVARPFKKFHNLNTPSIPESCESNLPNCQPTVTEKLDGSLGILWRYGPHWGLSTRGSFTSPQADWANRWAYRLLYEGDDTRDWDFPAHYTPLFEILYPENRIVCKYDFEGLVLLGLVDAKTGAEAPYSEVVYYAKRNGIQPVKLYNKSLAECAAANEPGREGYVLTYHRGVWQEPVKVKVKFADYVRLHRIVTGISPKAIWEMLADGQSFQIFDDCPAHFQQWAHEWRKKLESRFAEIASRAEHVFINRPLYDVKREEKWNRKQCALYFQKEAPELQGVLFSMLDHDDGLPGMGKETCKLVWKMLKPHCTTQDTFRKDGE